MNVASASVQKHKVGTCPHGMPLGACPICNGMGGGGGGSARKAAKPSNEMSWDECYAVWQQILKAQQLTQQKRDMAQAQLNAPVNFTSKLQNAAQKIANFAERLADFVQKTQSMPKIIAKPLALVAKIAIPVLNVLKNIPILVEKATNFVKEKLADISDKLNAVFGELKNAVEKKISDKFKDYKKKIKSLFGIFEPEEEDKKIEEEKRIFELKTVFQSIHNKLFNKKELIDERQSD